MGDEEDLEGEKERERVRENLRRERKWVESMIGQ